MMSGRRKKPTETLKSRRGRTTLIMQAAPSRLARRWKKETQSLARVNSKTRTRTTTTRKDKRKTEKANTIHLKIRQQKRQSIERVSALNKEAVFMVCFQRSLSARPPQARPDQGIVCRPLLQLEVQPVQDVYAKAVCCVCLSLDVCIFHCFYSCRFP